jgi:integrase
MSIKVRAFKGSREGYEVDIHTDAIDGTPIRERVKSPISTREGAKRWGMLREAHLALAHGLGGCRCKADGKEQATRLQTVEEAALAWIKQRQDEKIQYADVEEQRLKAHVLPKLGKMRVVDVRPKDAYRLVKHLTATPSNRGGALAPRTVRGIFFTTRQVFQHLVLEEVIPGNPIVVARGILPRVQDKNPEWRSGAVFTVDEVEQLLSDERIAVHRRVAYAIEFLTGLRTGQVSALRWGDYEPGVGPLGRLISALSYNSVRKTVKSTKTGVTHEVPVHPTLARVLATWKLTGWRARMKRPPAASDLIVPTINGTHRDVRKALEDFHEDLERLGLRKRRHYDARRTFISLGLDAGASKDLLQSITHPRPADAFDLYRTPGWAARCQAVAMLKIELREGKLIGLIQPQKQAVVVGHGVLTEYGGDTARQNPFKPTE